ncbi:MAG: putative Ig domain-containing protein [Opitutaceae bacterium]|nr:putative Ig domain-containing protein [Opitutaceae bacterium]
MIHRPRFALQLCRLFILATVCLLAGAAGLSAQTRYIERGVGAGNSPTTFLTTDRLLSANELQIDPGPPLRVATDNGGAGYAISREATSLVRRLASLGDGVEMSVRSVTSTSATDLTAIPATTLNGQRPFARSYVTLVNERVEASAADPAASTVRVRIHASFSFLSSSLRSENRIWTPSGQASLLVSGTIYRRSGNLRISDFGSSFSITSSRFPSGPTVTATSVFGANRSGATFTPDFPGVGVAGGSGAWNELNNTGMGYLDLTIPNGSYIEFTVTCSTSSEIQSFSSPQALIGDALANQDTSATGRVWVTAPEGGSAIGQLGTTLRAQTVNLSLSDLPLGSPAFDLPETSSAGLPMSYAVASGPATVSGRIVTPGAARGEVVISATQAGNGDFLPISVTRSFRLTGLAQTIEFPAPASRTASSAPFIPTAIASSGLPVTFAVLSGPASTTDGRTITLSGEPGTVVLRASQAGDDTREPAPSVERSLTVTTGGDILPTPQEITFPSLLNAPVGSVQLLSATASSGLPVTYTVIAGSATISGANNNLLSATAAGLVTVRATQPGGERLGVTYAAANPVERSFTATANEPAEPREQSINPSLPLNLEAGAAPTLLFVSASSGLPVTITLVSSYPDNIATLAGNQLSASAPGFVTLRLSQPGGERFGVTYAAAETVERIIPVQPAGMRSFDLHGAWTLATPEPGLTVALVFAADGKYYHAEAGNDDPNGEPGLEAGTYTWSTLGGAFTASPERDQNREWGLSHPRGAMNLIVTGDTAHLRDGTDFYTLRRVRSTSPLVGAWRLPVEGGEAVLVFFADNSYVHLETATPDDAGEPGIEVGTFVWNASTGRLTNTVSLDLNGEWGLSHNAPDFTLRVSGAELAVREGGAVVATATRVGSAAPAKAQRITFARPANRVFGSAPLSLVASSDSRLPVTFTVISGSALLGEDGRTLTLVGAGEVVVRASQFGDVNFAPATPVEHTFLVTRAAQRITFNAPAPATVGDDPFSLIASSSSGLPIAFEIVSSVPAGATVYNPDLGTLRALAAGRVTLRASQAGNVDYTAAAPVTRVLEIRPRAPLALTTTAGDEFYVGGRPVRALAVDPPSTDLRYFASGLPAGLALSPTTGELTGVITARPGTYTVRVWTQLGSLRSAFSTSTVTVNPFPSAFVGGFQIPLATPDEARLPWGRLDLQVAATGLYTGTLHSSAAAPRAVRGRLHPSADGTLALTELTTPQGVISLAFGNDPLVEAEVVQGDVTVARANGYLPLRTRADGNVPWVGAYTLSFGAFTPLANPENPYPAGPGYATGRVAASGVFSIKGHLADGTPLTVSLAPGRGEGYDDYPVYHWFVRPHKAGENYLAGHTFLTRDDSVTPVRYDISRFADQQEIYWKKSPQTGSGAYAAGFDPLRTLVRLQAWSPPTTARNLAARLGAPATPAEIVPVIAFEGMDPATPWQDDGLPARVLLAANNRFSLPTDTPAANARAWSLGLDTATGRITGGFLIPAAPDGSARARNVRFTGVLFQPGANTYGGVGEAYYLVPPAATGGPTLSGALYLWFPD